MADNIGYTPGSGATVSADEILGILFQRIKLTLGADGVNDGDVSSSNPMPIAAYGELIEAIEAMRMSVQSLNRTIGLAQVNPCVIIVFSFVWLDTIIIPNSSKDSSFNSLNLSVISFFTKFK